MNSFGRVVRIVMAVATIGAMGVMFSASASAADSTTWICKPGQADDLCAGTISGSSMPAPGQSSEPLPYTRPEKPAIDCFYLYPTQSEQATPNSNLDKDPPIRRVVVQQARMFSSVCNVYAPMYNQVTYNGNQLVNSPDVEVAYASAKAAFEDYLENYNQGRPFVMLGHSQGSAHTGRLIDEMVDKDASLRKRFVGAIAPGANIYVPIGENIGGMYDNVPACSEVGQFGCLTAFSSYNGDPGPTAAFSRLDFGYWIYPEARPDPARYETVCTNPALLDGGNGNLLPLVNFDYISGVPETESASPWSSESDYYKVSCMRQGGAHWLDVSKVGLAGDARPDLAAIVASGTNYHVPEVNLAEGNLIRITELQTESYLAHAGALKKLGVAKKKLAAAKKALVKSTMTCKKATKAARKAAKKGGSAKKRAAKAAKKKCRRVAGQAIKVGKLKAQVKKYTKLSQV